MCSVIAGLTALGGMMQYRQQQQAANAQAAVYRSQAAAAEQNARIENRKQEQIADNYAQQQRQLRSRQRLAAGQRTAAAGAAGLNYAGSVADIGRSSLENYRDDALTLLSNQRNDNYSSRVAESNYISQANAANAAAGNVKRAARMQGISTILGTAASVYGVNQSWKNEQAAQAWFTAHQSWKNERAAQAWFTAPTYDVGVGGTMTPGGWQSGLGWTSTRRGISKTGVMGRNYFPINKYTFPSGLMY